jgi:hypothetical protein
LIAARIFLTMHDEMSKFERKLERGAYHESGQIVVAAKLGLRLRREGLNVDPAGDGLACYHKDSDDSDISKERVIIASFAGFRAEIGLCEKRSYALYAAVLRFRAQHQS